MFKLQNNISTLRIAKFAQTATKGGEAEVEKAQLSRAERAWQESNPGILAKPGRRSLEHPGAKPHWASSFERSSRLLLLIMSFMSVSALADTASNKKLSYSYDENAINFVSSKQINAIEFPVPIAQVNYPPYQFSKVFNRNSKSLSYVNHNKTLLFYLSSGADDIQFVVTLENGNVLSLYFKSDQLQGRIVHVPTYMSAQSIEENEKHFTVSKNKYLDFDLKIKSLMKSSLFNNGIVIREAMNKNIHIKKYKSFKKGRYSLDKFEICSVSKNRLLIELEKYFGGDSVVAYTLDKEVLFPHECSRLVVFSAHDSNYAV